jgi:hypothetical protein
MFNETRVTAGLLSFLPTQRDDLCMPAGSFQRQDQPVAQTVTLNFSEKAS